MIHFKPYKFGHAEIWFIVALVFLAGLSIGIVTIPSVASWYAKVTDVWTSWALRYGYFGAFFSALIGSVSLVVIFPYTVIVFFLATQGLDPFLLGLLMGLGAATGQMSGYLIGLWGAHYVQEKRPETYDALERIVNYRPAFVGWLIFAFAVTPLPDDVIFIPLGILRYPWWRVAIPTVAGKVISGLIVTYSSRLIGHVLNVSTAASLSSAFGQIVTFVAVAVIVYLFFRLDWQTMMHRLIDRHVPPSPEHSRTPL